METNSEGTMQENTVPEEKSDLDQAIDQAVEGTDTEQGATVPDQIIEEPELSPAEYKKQIEQLQRERDHWQQTVSKQGEEVGRLRKLENTIYELQEKDKALAKQEAENEYDTDKLVDIRADRKNIQNQTNLVNREVLKAQTIQKVPDFEELITTGHVRDTVLEVAKANGINPTEADINLAIDNLRYNPAQAITIATTARAKKQIATLTNKQKKTTQEVNNMTRKVTAANENNIVTNGKSSTPKLTVDQIRAMTPEQRSQIIEAGKKDGSLYKK